MSKKTDDLMEENAKLKSQLARLEAEQQEAQAVDERAAFESTLPPSLSRETFVDEDGDTIYCDTWVQGASIGWSRRAALATQPAAYVLTKDGEIYWEGDDGIVISNTTGDCLDESYEWLPVGFISQPVPPAAAHGDNK